FLFFLLLLRRLPRSTLFPYTTLFRSYEGTVDRRLADGRVSVPTLSMRNGDLTASPSRIFDPFTGNPDGSGKTEFTNKVIPSTSIDPIAQKIRNSSGLSALPLDKFRRMS